MSVIEIKELTKHFSAKSFSKEKIKALEKVSFTTDTSEIFGLLGPNGAGKTTLVKILLGITFSTSGDAKIFGRPVSDVNTKKKIGYLPENHRFPQYLTGEQVINYFGKLSGVNSKVLKTRTVEYLGMVGMEKWKNTKIKKYSKGMMQRLGLAQSMINNPDLIFLDEPTDGVDPIGRKEIRDILIHLKSKGKTIFLNSHLLSEIELICDRVAILNKGILIKEGSVEDITTKANTYKFNTNELNDKIMNLLLNQHKAVLNGRNEFLCNVKDVEELNGVIDYLRTEKILILSVQQEKNSLESMFINLIEQQKN
jgi:ABC-2 type transport system ATP-binding protein